MTRASTTPDYGGVPAQRLLPSVLSVIDLMLLLATVTLALLGRQHLSGLVPIADLSGRTHVVCAAVVVTWLMWIAVLGGYQRDVLVSGTAEFKRVANAGLLTAGVIGVGCYLARYDFPRGFFILTFLIGPVLLVLGRAAVRYVLHRARARGHFQTRVLLAGTPQRIDEVSGVLSRENWLGYSVVGGATIGAPDLVETSSGVPVLGAADNLIETAIEHAADMVVVTGGVASSAATLTELMWDLEQHHISLVVAPNLADISQDRMRVRPVGGVPLIHVDHPRWARAGRVGKRLFDIAGASVAIVVLAPLIVFAAARVRLHDGGPVLFRHARIGRNGEQFDCLKFRTMVVDAEQLVRQLQAESDQEALLFKMKDDPRITGPGTWLRRLSIDELPQLFNVLRGEMSLVGPRPQVQREVEQYQGGMSRRLLVRPGITGLWQVSGRNDLTVDEAMRLDVYYVDNWSMLQDLSILARTVTAVLSARGAY